MSDKLVQQRIQKNYTIAMNWKLTNKTFTIENEWSENKKKKEKLRRNTKRIMRRKKIMHEKSNIHDITWGEITPLVTHWWTLLRKVKEAPTKRVFFCSQSERYTTQRKKGTKEAKKKSKPNVWSTDGKE